MFVKYTAAKNNDKCAAAGPVVRAFIMAVKVSLRRNKPLAATQWRARHGRARRVVASA
jgi:hypothetical protein